MKQLIDDFARYLYLPRLAGPEVLVHAIRDGVALLTWQSDAFAYAESHDDAAGRYPGLRGGQVINVSTDSGGMLVKPIVARAQLDAEAPSPTPGPTGGTSTGGTAGVDGDGEPATAGDGSGTPQPKPQLPRRFHGTVQLDPTRVGRDASRIADEVIAHLAGQVGAEVTVTLEIEATLPGGASEKIVRTVTENGRTLKFSLQGFETE